MAYGVKLTITGNKLPQLMAMLDTIEDTMADRTADRGVTYVQEAAPKKTGRGAASYHKEAAGQGVRIITNTPDAYYMLFVELGTRYMSAQPHVVPSALRLAADIPAIFTDLVNSTLG